MGALDLLSRWLQSLRTRTLSATTAPPVYAPAPSPSGGNGYPTTPGIPSSSTAGVWTKESDGQRYPGDANYWEPQSSSHVVWEGHSRPYLIQDMTQLGNPNHVQCKKKLTVPAGMTKLTFTVDITAVNNHVDAEVEPVTGSIYIWNARQLSPVNPVSAYRVDGFDNTVTNTVEAVMENLLPGETVVLYLQAFSPAGGHITYDTSHVFSP